MKDFKLGNHIYCLRTNMGLTQEELAEKLGVSNKAISKWENGSSRPSIKNLQMLSVVFDISLDELLMTGSDESEKKIFKIVLTGGPCAGKSTAMNWIQNFFVKQGYGVIFVPETATELITGGLTPWNSKSNMDYQSTVLDLQLAKENIFTTGAYNMKEDKILIVCDRGALDNKAYISNKDFQFMLKSKGLNEVELRDSYDAVFHLVTAAKGAEEFYNLGNKARTETKEEAIRLDDKTISAWTGHPHLRIIDNSTDFDTKMKRLLIEISHFLGEPEPYEIERKFLIEMPDLELLEKLPNCTKVQIIQTYLKSPDGEEIRIRQRGSNGNYTYSKTRKVNVSGATRVEVEKRLTKDEYLKELFNADPTKNQIIKDRYCLSYKNEYFELDVYPFWDNNAILEIELNSEDQEIVIPNYFKVIKEVTDDYEYKNVNLAKKKVKEKE